MSNAIVDGLSLVDSTGRLILASTVATLLAGVAAHVYLRARYAALARDLERNGQVVPRFESAFLQRVVLRAEEVARAPERNTQAVIEEAFEGELRPLLLAERFVRSATGLVIILGLLGTFYGLTLSIGRLVDLVSGGDAGAAADVAQAVTHGLTQALTGMAVAFSNSLFGITSAVVLTILGVVSNVTDRRTALMIRVEAYLDRMLAARAAPPRADPAAFGESIARLEGAVMRFEAALQGFASATKDLREVHLVVALKPDERR